MFHITFYFLNCFERVSNKNSESFEGTSPHPPSQCKGRYTVYLDKSKINVLAVDKKTILILQTLLIKKTNKNFKVPNLKKITLVIFRSSGEPPISSNAISIIYFCGHSLSLVALLIAFSICIYFK